MMVFLSAFDNNTGGFERNFIIFKSYRLLTVLTQACSFAFQDIQCCYYARTVLLLCTDCVESNNVTDLEIFST
jgi:hypothetical protein